MSALSLTPLRQTTLTNDVDELWEEMEALELDMGMDTGCGGGGGGGNHYFATASLIRHFPSRFDFLL